MGRTAALRPLVLRHRHVNPWLSVHTAIPDGQVLWSAFDTLYGARTSGAELSTVGAISRTVRSPLDVLDLKKLVMTSHPFALRLDTELPKKELEASVRAWQPWGHRIEFSNGVSTADFERRTPFSDNPLQKFDIVMKAIGERLPADARTLDIGCNAGYNSIAASQRFGAEVIGIDTSERHVEVSAALAEMGGVADLCTFKVESAETLAVDGEFDLILHFGTLYHLPNPILSLQRCYDLAKPGAWLAIETQIFRDERDDNLCSFMNMQNNDPTNFWALSPSVLERILRLIGFGDLEILLEVRPPILESGMSRIIAVAQKTPLLG